MPTVEIMEVDLMMVTVLDQQNRILSEQGVKDPTAVGNVGQNTIKVM